MNQDGLILLNTSHQFSFVPFSPGLVLTLQSVLDINNMHSPATQTVTLWPLAVYFAAVIVVVAGMLVLSYLLGQRHQERATGEPYESGIVSTGSARLRFSAKFYLIAILFVIFDLEVVFIFAWAVAFRELGWTGYLGALVFIGVLMAALIYEWRIGALDWGGRRSKTSAAIDQIPKLGDAALRQITARKI